MKRTKLQSRNPQICAIRLCLISLVVFAVSSAQAQQNAPAAPAAANQTQTKAPTPAPGAPTMGFRAPVGVADRVAVAPAKPAVQVAAAPSGPRLDPMTHAPISTLASRPVSPEETSLAEANNQAEALASDGSLHQGLKVHGHWVINVSNPDGTQVQHHEFENALESSAQGFMVGVLSGYMIPGDWMIVLGSQSGPAACNGTYEFCGLVHNAATFPAQGYCGIYYCTGSTLSYAYNFGSGFDGPYSIVLSGTITANQTGTIGNVYTLLSTCANIGYSSSGTDPNSIETSSPSTCAAQTSASPQPWYGPFTDTNITPISVTNGQLVQAIVTITFS